MNIKEYRVSFLKIIKFVIIILVADFVLGSVSQKIFFSQKTGKYARATYAVEKSNAEVLIFGSSHAHRHYVPEVFEKELNKTCYNAGAEGQQLLFHTALQEMIIKRKKPDLMILNIDDSFLYLSDIAYDRLSDLHPYYDDHSEALRPILGLKSNLIDFKLFFKSYQTNSTIIHALRYYVSPQVDYKGYRPLYGKVNSNTKKHDQQEVKEYIEVIEKDFVNALKTFINNAKENNINLVFATSPTYNKVNYSENKSFSLIKEIAGKENVPFIDLFNDTQFLNKGELFHDPSHLNDDGAKLFTKLLADKILEKNLIIK
ncbi:hypothetical protein [Aquimarina sp. MMG016]|uniref:hypothetical protein n=1 Tax=Aquimarina sp. MMG016 TaxID=2822690 RepID=UPI001B3A333A|nr:hypothetical protein [Aquimarina sp. MMG016]MBQ4819559.1 hypothetical protein [Aquimarina sp. MMG016]